MKIFKFTIWTVLALTFVCFSSCKSKKGTTVTAQKSGVQFTKSDSLTDVLEKAAAEDKLVFVDFYTTWCLPCRLMDEDVFPDRRLGDFMNENFINYKVNAEKGNGVNLSTLYNISAFPTLLFLDQNGKVLERKLGATYQREMFALGEAALAGVQ